MARVLIGASALEELRSLEPVALRRRLVTRLAALDFSSSDHRLCSAERYRVLVGGARVLYRRRDDGTVVITAVRGRSMA